MKWPGIKQHSCVKDLKNMFIRRNTHKYYHSLDACFDMSDGTM